MSENHKLNEHEFNELFNNNTSLKRHAELTEKINERFNYIVKFIYDTAQATVDWFDYDNGYNETNGHFDYNSYQHNIGYTGEFIFNNNINEKFLYDKDFIHRIPTKWLKENFEVEFKNELTEYVETFNQKQQQEKKEKQNIKDNIQNIRSSILSKLSDEEKCYITFADIGQVQKNFQKLKEKDAKQKYYEQNRKNRLSKNS